MVISRLSWLSEALASEPGIRANRSQWEIVGPLFELDLMHADRFTAVAEKDLLRAILLLRGPDSNPQNETAPGRQRRKAFVLAR
jgi:hypothetical protein